MPIVRVKSVKIYTGQNKFTRAPPVAPVTNIRYDSSDRINSSNIAISKRIVPRGLNHLEPNKEKRSMAYHIIDGF